PCLHDRTLGVDALVQEPADPGLDVDLARALGLRDVLEYRRRVAGLDGDERDVHRRLCGGRGFLLAATTHPGAAEASEGHDCEWKGHGVGRRHWNPSKGCAALLDRRVRALRTIWKVRSAGKRPSLLCGASRYCGAGTLLSRRRQRDLPAPHLIAEF